MHIPEEEFLRRIDAAKKEIEVGARYAHYKDETKIYTVRDIVILEATGEAGVVYEAQYGAQLIFVRSAEVWREEVLKDGVRVPRFRKL